MGPGAFALGLLQGLAGCGIHNETMCKRARLGSFFCLSNSIAHLAGVERCVVDCVPRWSAGRLHTERENENRPDATGFVGEARKMGSIEGFGMASFFLKACCHLCD